MDKGICVKGILQSDSRITSKKTRVTSKNQQLLRIDEEKTEDVREEFLSFINTNIEKLFKNVDAIIISDYGKGVVTKESAKIIIEFAKNNNILIGVDPKGNDYSKYTNANFCTPNEKELREITNCNCFSEDEIYNESIKLCNKYNFDFILNTRSEKGISMISKRDGVKRDYPAIKKEVIDVTGAGDTVVSIFTLCVASGINYDDSCKLANIAASIVISRFGAATITLDDLVIAFKDQKNERSKIFRLNELKGLINQEKRNGKRIVFTNGCYDLVHAGHISSFEQARKFGDVLIVAINSDSSIKRIKGPKRPIIDEKNRAKLLSAIDIIDYITIFDDDTPKSVIDELKPDVLVKGKDWEGKEVVGSDTVLENGGEVQLINMVDNISTTRIIEKILDIYGENKWA